MITIRKTKLVATLLVTFSLLSSSSCCRFPRSQPSYPKTVAGWKDSYENTTHFIAELVLKKGEVSEGDKVGVKVVDIKDPNIQCGLMPEPSVPQVTLQFYQPMTKDVLCEITTSTGNSFLRCDSRAGVYVVGVRAINSTEGWVHFDLRE